MILYQNLSFPKKGVFVQLAEHSWKTPQKCETTSCFLTKMEFSEKRKFLFYWLDIHEERTENVKPFIGFLPKMEFPEKKKLLYY